MMTFAIDPLEAAPRQVETARQTKAELLDALGHLLPLLAIWIFISFFFCLGACRLSGTHVCWLLLPTISLAYGRCVSHVRHLCRHLTDLALAGRLVFL